MGVRKDGVRKVGEYGKWESTESGIIDYISAPSHTYVDSFGFSLGL